MVIFPNAKINIGLNITEKLASGYHVIESCFYPIPLKDALEVIESKKLSFASSGIPIPGNRNDNLCLKAYHLLKEPFDLPPVAIHLHKNIPIGAGLGGGSADGAFMIKLLNQKFNLKISIKKQEAFASQLGSDCPFFIRNKPMYVEGTGNIFSDITFSLKDKYLALVMPNIHVSTTEAYARVNPKKSIINLKEALENGETFGFQQTIKNDFEKTIFEKHAELEQIKAELILQGALYAGMSGSGAAIFGVFEEVPSVKSSYPSLIAKL